MKRKVLGEEFFTPSDLAQRCVTSVGKRFPLGSFDLIVEPSAGTGAFFELLPDERRLGIDITPRHSDLLEMDFLEWNPPAQGGRILTIGNPPFGQRAAIAVQFVERACLFSQVVAFILPRSFKKYTFQNRVPKDFHLVDWFDCEDFLRPDGETVKVKAVFQVWERRSSPRALMRPPDTHPDFGMKHGHLSRLSPEEVENFRTLYEFTIPQVGSDFRPRDVDQVTKGSHWFIRPHADGVRERFERLDFSFLDGMNTAHTSLSKRDIVAAYIAAGGSSEEHGPGGQGALYPLS
jgi:hypothetical protein